MVFILFTDHYRHENIFEKFNACEYVNNDALVVAVTKEMLSHLLYDDDETHQLKPENISILFIKDINIEEEELIQKILVETFNAHEEIFVVYHNNGNCSQHSSLIQTLTDQHCLSEKFDSHLSGSVYYENMGRIATAYARDDKETFAKELQNLKNDFIEQERNKTHQFIYNPSIIDKLDDLDNSVFAQKYVYKTDLDELKQALMLLDGKAEIEKAKELDRIVLNHLQFN